MSGDKLILYLRTITPTHVGIGRGYAGYVDQPVQRDEYGFPTIWASSLKGAIKANLTGNVRQCFGPDPGDVEVSEFKQSRVLLTDARLVFMPARVITGVYAYMTSPLLLRRLAEYVGVLHGESKAEELLKGISSIEEAFYDKEEEGKKKEKVHAVVSSKQLLRADGTLIINELSLKAKVHEFEGGKDLIDGLGLKEILPSDIVDSIKRKQLVVVTDEDNLSPSLVNRSMMIQYRVRLGAETKTVEHGPWSEEYVPSETIFSSVIVCRPTTVHGGQPARSESCGADSVGRALSELGALFIGGKETIGRGLVRVYVYPKKTEGKVGAAQPSGPSPRPGR